MSKPNSQPPLAPLHHAHLVANGPDLVRRVSYRIFIVAVTVIALALTGMYYLVPLPDDVREVLYILNYFDALILLFDVFVRFALAPRKMHYLLPWGLLDFLGSLPGIPLLRLLRLPSLVIAWRDLRRSTPRELLTAARSRLAESTLLSGIIVVLLVVGVGSMGMVWVESPVVGSNIKTGGDALWYAIVTIATVGYGDRYPVTMAGRLIGSAMILTGVGIFSVLTGYISTQFLSPARRARQHDTGALRQEMAKLFEEQRAAAAADRAALEQEIAALREELTRRG